MTYNIDVSPQLSERLAVLAQNKGIDPTKLLETLVAEYVTPAVALPPVDALKRHFYYTATQEQFRMALDEIADMNHGLPGLPDEAFDRGSIYEDRL